jgi:hypothetical protein
MDAALDDRPLAYHEMWMVFGSLSATLVVFVGTR